MVDLLAHVCLGYAMGGLLSLRTDWLDARYVTVVMVGAVLPELVKIYLIVDPRLVSRILDIPFALAATPDRRGCHRERPRRRPARFAGGTVPCGLSTGRRCRDSPRRRWPAAVPDRPVVRGVLAAVTDSSSDPGTVHEYQPGSDRCGCWGCDSRVLSSQRDASPLALYIPQFFETALDRFSHRSFALPLNRFDTL